MITWVCELYNIAYTHHRQAQWHRRHDVPAVAPDPVRACHNTVRKHESRGQTMAEPETGCTLRRASQGIRAGTRRMAMAVDTQCERISIATKATKHR